MPTELEKLVDTLLKKVYARDKKKLKKHSKKAKSIRKKKKSKKLALHSHFCYADKLLEYNQRRLGQKVSNVYNKRRRGALKRMNNKQVNRMFDDTRIRGDDPFREWARVYRSLEELDWMDRQREAYNNYYNQHLAYNAYKNVGQ